MNISRTVWRSQIKQCGRKSKPEEIPQAQDADAATVSRRETEF